VNLAGPDAIVQAVPYLLGHAGLHEDLVVVCTRNHRHALVLRVGLTHLGTAALWARTADAMAAAGTEAVYLVAYPAGPVTDTTLAHLHTAFDCAAVLRPPHLKISRAITTADGRWWEHDLTGPAPAGPGTPVTDDPAVTLGLSIGFGVPARDRDQILATLAAHPEPVLRQVHQAIDGLPKARTRDQRRRAAHQALAARAARPVSWQIPEAAAVLDALTDSWVRDELVVVSDRQHAAWTWSTLLPYAPPRWLAPVATLTAVAVHQRGDGILARAAIDRALQADPGYRLAGMFRQVLDLGLTPQAVRDNLLTPVAQELAGQQP
jgi:hypothetical protein